MRDDPDATLQENNIVSGRCERYGLVDSDSRSNIYPNIGDLLLLPGPLSHPKLVDRSIAVQKDSSVVTDQTAVIQEHLNIAECEEELSPPDPARTLESGSDQE